MKLQRLCLEAWVLKLSFVNCGIGPTPNILQSIPWLSGDVFIPRKIITYWQYLVLWSTSDMQCFVRTLSFTFLARHSRERKWYNNLQQLWSMFKKSSKQSTGGNAVSGGSRRGKLEARESLGSTWQRGRCSFPSPEGENVAWWLLAYLHYARLSTENY